VRTRPHGGVAPLVFFLDRNLGRHTIAQALRQAGAHVEIHDDHFPRNAKDEEWLRDVGQRGWIILTNDKKIRYRANERTALMQANGRAFVIVARGDISAHVVAEMLVRALPAIRRFVTRHAPPFIARVTRVGTVALLVTR
jgi:predicted nuclease of predicted toxin-antitoxin system